VEQFGIDTTSEGYDFWPTGSGSVWCIMGSYIPSGYLATRGYRFEGEESDPLTFLLLDKLGLVYLHGKGKVITKDGKEVKLGYAKQKLAQTTDLRNELVIKEIQPTLTGYENYAVIEVRTRDNERELWVKRENKEGHKLVMARGGLWVRAIDPGGEGSIQYGTKGERICGPGTEVLLCREDIDNCNWFAGNIDYEGSTYILVGKVPLNGYVFESQREDPLTFKIVKEQGFVYLSGRGKVTGRDGKVTTLEPVPSTAAKEQVVTLTGKVEMKLEKAIKGKDYEVMGDESMLTNPMVLKTYITVTTTIGKDGRVISEMSGKRLEVVGKNINEVQKFDGKQVQVKGTVKSWKEIEVISVTGATEP